MLCICGDIQVPVLSKDSGLSELILRCDTTNSVSQMNVKMEVNIDTVNKFMLNVPPP